jgi:AAA domain
VLEPDRDQIEIFVEALFRHATPGAFLSLRSFYEDRSETFRINAIKLNGNFAFLCDCATDGARQAANAADKVVFAPPIATSRNGRGAAEADIAEGLVLSVECDAQPQRGREKLESMLGPATIVTRSGGRWLDPQSGGVVDKLHLHWRLAETAGDKPTLGKLKRARDLAARIVGADPSGKSVVHPYRWPGSWHRKAEPRPCEIETADPDREIVLEDALEVLAEAAGAAPEAEARASGNGDDRHRTEWEDAFRQILTGESYHPTLVPLAASLASWGAPEPVTDNVLRCLLINSTPQDAERKRRRDAELTKLPETVASAYAKFGKGEDKSERKQERLHWHSDEDRAPLRAWLVNGLLPETGVGLISGQWGTYKTFVSLDLAAAVMAGLAFIDYPIARNGGALFIAVEGASEIAARLQAVLKTKYPDRAGKLPFAWIDECPRLLGPGAVNALAALAREATDRMQKDFGVPLVLIIVDTMADAAGYARSGDENDAALAQLVMHRCAQLSRLTGALVLGVDHFGKAVETGTRGSSAKEGRADVVLALLGDKAISGEITNTRLAVRKNRAGPGGRELPFGVRSVNLGTDENGEPISSLVIEWSGQAAPATADRHWGKSLRLLRRILMALLADAGKEVRPFPEGPMVRACDLELVRGEFNKQYVAEGNDRQKADARRKAFQRAISGAQDLSLIAVREMGGVQLVWLAKPEDGGET